MTAPSPAVIEAPLWRRAVGWTVLPVVIAVHFLAHDPAYPPLAVACAAVLASLSVLAMAYAKPGVVPVLPIILAQTYLSMGSAVFYPPLIHLVEGSLRLPGRALEEAALASLLYVGCATVTYFSVSNWSKRFAPGIARLLDRHEYTAVDSIVARAVACFLLGVYCVAATGDPHAPTFGSFAFIVGVLTVPTLFLGLLLWDLEKTGHVGSRILLWTAAFVTLVVGLSTGMLENTVAPLVSIAVLAWTMQGRVPVAAAAAALLLLLSLSSAKHIYRELSWNTGTTLTFTEQASNWAEAIERTYFGGTTGAEAFSTSAETTAGRFLTFPQVAHIFDWVPQRVPHAGPDQWLKLPLEFIPRVFWKEKPLHIVEYNQRYTLSFRLQTREGVRTTAVALPPVGDGYWRLGWLGVMIEGGLFGVLFGLFSGFGSAKSRALAIIACAGIAGLSSDAHVMALYAGFPQFLFALGSLFVALNGLAILAQAMKRRRFVIRAKPRLSN